MLQLRKQQVGVVLVHVHHELAVHTQKAYHLQLLIGQASLPGKIRDEKLGVLVTNQDNTMNSSEDSLQSLSSTNALGESLGRGLVSFTF